MTPLLLVIAGFCFLVWLGATLVDIWFGPDPDLHGPWQPGDQPRDWWK